MNRQKIEEMLRERGISDRDARTALNLIAELRNQRQRAFRARVRRDELQTRASRAVQAMRRDGLPLLNYGRGVWRLGTQKICREVAAIIIARPGIAGCGDCLLPDHTLAQTYRHEGMIRPEKERA
jgi:hypothetical protein